MVVLTAALPVALLSVLLAGRYPNTGFISPSILFDDPLALRLVLELRLPRALAAIFLGSALAVAGVVMQMLFANPLVEPGLIGVSQGAAFGASLMIVIVGARPWAVQGAAAAGALIGLGCAYTIARRLRFGGWILRLVLSGIAVSAILSAGVGLIKFVADPLEQLPAITFWLLGGLWNVGWPELARVFPPVAISLVVLYLARWRVNLLSLEDRVSFSLGAAPGRERAAILVAATVAVASVISVAGIVGWVGLIVPHAARRLFRADAAASLPAAALLGATFVLLADGAARTVIAGEIPLGVITALLGAPAFVALMMTHNIRVAR